jgi:glycogen operon protein
LNDVVTYNGKHNEANGEDNRDGTSDNRSWNCGAEGPTEDPEINALRERQIRNFMATLLLSQGTPMILAGDEFGRTQQGNNNAYCQDNEIGWLDWNLKAKGKGLTEFIRKLTALRHRYPIFRRNLFLDGQLSADLGVRDVTWINPEGQQMGDADWHNPGLRTFGMLLDGRAPTSGIRQRGKEATILIIINGHHEVVGFALPEVAGARHWCLLLDTNFPQMEFIEGFAVGTKYWVAPRSMLAFTLQADPLTPETGEPSAGAAK